MNHYNNQVLDKRTLLLYDNSRTVHCITFIFCLNERGISMKRRDFLKLSAAAALAGAAAACGAAPAASASSVQAVSPAPSAGSASPASSVGADTASLTTNEGDVIALTDLQHQTQDAAAPVVYFTREISAAALVRAYEALGWTPSGRVAVKLSTGEPPASNYLRPELVADLIHQLNGTIVECNTAYGGARSSTEEHYQVAREHGFADIATVQIQDENGSMTLPVEGGARLQENYVGAAFADYDSYVVLSHFKGHAMAGYGGAIKNISIGLGSREGKQWIHSGGTGGSMWSGEQDAFLEAMGDAGKSVSDALGHGAHIVYLNVMNRLSVDCDCDGNPAEPEMADIGILASADPVALDQACIDLVYAAPNHQALAQRIESRNGIHTLENAQAIGLGSRSYRLELLEG